MSTGEYTGKPEVFPIVGGSSSDAPSAELFIVEGRSAALSVASLRDATFQAVLGLQGKPINAFKASQRKISGHPFYSLLSQQIENQHSTGQLILLFDPDADGIHCSALVLGYLLRFHVEALEQGRVMAARAPLLEVITRSPPREESTRAAFGETSESAMTETFYAYADGTTNRLLRDIRIAGLEIVSRRYFRGLGGIPPAILLNQCISPRSRQLLQVTKGEAEAAVDIFLQRATAKRKSPPPS